MLGSRSNFKPIFDKESLILLILYVAHNFVEVGLHKAIVYVG